MHLFFEGRRNKEFANVYKRCGMPKKIIHKAVLPVKILVGMLGL